MFSGAFSEDSSPVYVVVEPLVVNRRVAAQMMGGEGNLQRCIDADWLEAIGGKQRGMEFYVRDLKTCAAQARLQGWPQSTARGRKCCFS
jgi:hypothetical protein